MPSRGGLISVSIAFHTIKLFPDLEFLLSRRWEEGEDFGETSMSSVESLPASRVTTHRRLSRSAAPRGDQGRLAASYSA